MVTGTCFYWLHTHTENGVIHVESPTQATFTLGQLFDIWGQPLNSRQVSFGRGSLVAFVDGSTWAGDVRAIPLTSHTVIQIDVGQVVPPQPYIFESDL